MNILAVTCYTGGEELVAMTERCCEQLQACRPDSVDPLWISAYGQGASRMAMKGAASMTNQEENIGFARGMNGAIDMGLKFMAAGDLDFVLCFNNDLEFPDKDWLRILLEIAVHPVDQVIVPATDSAAIRVQPGPLNKNSFPIEESSAYCWLVPFKFCQFLKETYGFWLFDEDFAPAYGEDNWTAFLLSKQFGEKVFRYVPRSFVKHLRARTSRTVEHDRKQSNRTLVDKLNGELKDPSLRPDLRRWAQRYVSILSTRL